MDNGRCEIEIQKRRISDEPGDFRWHWHFKVFGARQKPRFIVKQWPSLGCSTKDSAVDSARKTARKLGFTNIICKTNYQKN